MKKNSDHNLTRKLLDFLRTFYGVARMDGARLDGGIKDIDLPSFQREWAKAMTERALEHGKRLLTDIVYPMLAPYDDAIIKYSHHTPDCETWRDGECTCELDKIKHLIQNGYILEKRKII